MKIKRFTHQKINMAVCNKQLFYEKFSAKKALNVYIIKSGLKLSFAYIVFKRIVIMIQGKIPVLKHKQ